MPLVTPAPGLVTRVTGNGLRRSELTSGRDAGARPAHPRGKHVIIVTARLVFESEAARDAAVAATVDVQKATRDEEAGCLMYCFGPDPAVPNEIQVYELWTDPESLDAHFTHPNYAAMVEALHGVQGFRESINRLYVADDRGTVYDETGAPRIDALR